MHLSRSVLILTTALAAALTIGLQAQAPIERRDPPPALSTWPAPSAFLGHKRVLISTFDSPSTQLCQLRNVEPNRIICGGSTAAFIFDREQIASIATSPKGYAAVETLQKPLIEGGLVIGGLGLFCGVDGGPPCRTPTIIGLSMIATSVVLQIVKLHQRHHLPQLLYAATPPPPLPETHF